MATRRGLLDSLAMMAPLAMALMTMALVTTAACDAERQLERRAFACGLGGPCPEAADGSSEIAGLDEDGGSLPQWDGRIFGDLFGGAGDSGPAPDLSHASDAGQGDAGPTDAGTVDAGTEDAGPVDAGPVDVGPVDVGPTDAGPADAGPKDAGPIDAGSVDVGPVDAGPVDAGPTDAGATDAGLTDAGATDLGPSDVGPSDAGPTDTATTDAGQKDAGLSDAGPSDAGQNDMAQGDAGPPTQPCVGDIGLCDDANACTKDLCEPQTGCAHTPVAAKCATGCDPWAKCAAGVCILGQPNLFEVSLGGPGDQGGGDLLELADGVLMLAGTKGGAGANTDVVVMRLSAKGLLTGQTTVVGSGKNTVTAMASLADGTAVIAGDNDHDLNGVWRGSLLKTSAGGGPMWQKFYPGPGDAHFVDVVTQSGGQITVVGQVKEPGEAGLQGWLLRVVGFGSVAQSLSLGGAGDDGLYGAAADGDATVAVGAHAAGKDLEGWLLRVDGKGKVAWQKYIAGPGKRVARQVASRPAGGWVVAGQQALGGQAGWDGWLLATDGQGAVQWLRTWSQPGSQLPWALAVTADGGWLLGGTDVDPAGDSDGWLLRTDPSGNALWQRRYGGPGTQRGLAMRSLAGHGVALLGLRFDKNNETDVWLVRADPWGESDCSKSGACAFKAAGDCSDGQACTADLCGSGVCSHPPLSDGSPCGDGKTCATAMCK